MSEEVNEFRGQQVESYGRTTISEGFPFYFYDVSAPALSEDESAIVDAMCGVIVGRIGVDELDSRYGRFFSKDFVVQFKDLVIKPVTYAEGLEYLMRAEDVNSVRAALTSLLKQFFPDVPNPILAAEMILDESVGYGRISPIINDDNLEEIMVNGYD